MNNEIIDKLIEKAKQKVTRAYEHEDATERKWLEELEKMGDLNK